VAEDGTVELPDLVAIWRRPRADGPVAVRWDDGLRGTARDIAATEDSPLRVMAGPGTGKSYALKRRVARLVEDEAQDPKRILAVTFSRNAARELVNDIRALGVEGCEKVRTGTLHSICFRLLLKQEVFERLRRVPRPLVTFKVLGSMQFEATPMLQDLDDERFGDKRTKSRRVLAFEAAWARLQSETPGWPDDPADKAFHRELESWLTFHRAILIGELIPLAYRFLRDNPTSKERRAYDHVVVDEYQDLNRAEQVLVDLLCGEGALVVVGDEDQSIYTALRHAHPEGIRDFHVEHAGTHDEHLIECRRCPRIVVEMANHLITHNHPSDAPRRLRPHGPNGEGEVRLVQWETQESESRGVTAYIRHLVTDRGFARGEILVLCSLKDLGYRLREMLTEATVPAHSFYSEEPLKREDAAQEAFAFMRLTADPEDRVALRFLLGFESPSWLVTQYKVLRTACEHSGLSPWATLTRVKAGDITLPKTKHLLERFKAIHDRLARLTELRGRALVDVLFPSRHKWAEPFRDSAQVVLELDAETAAADLVSELVERVSHHDMPESGDFVRIMSLHKSKGLTSRAVIVMGCIQGLIPFMDWRVLQRMTPNEQEERLREQRRLFYVAITRTREVLVLSHPAGLPAGVANAAGLDVYGGASQFLSELGPARPNIQTGQTWQAKGFR
jgi:DNA helicase-2/ATP-dependent DNA helicase PcrA